jgi:hypothetical protein
MKRYQLFDTARSFVLSATERPIGRHCSLIVAICALSLTGCYDLVNVVSPCDAPNGLLRKCVVPPRPAGLYRVTIPSGDLNAEVGYPFNAYAGGECESDNYRETWTYNLYTTSAKLPPGLTLDNNGVHGIPTERGTWIFHLYLTGSSCNGVRYDDHDSEVRIHVKGSGQVIQQ